VYNLFRGNLTGHFPLYTSLLHLDRVLRQTVP
jgi:hypothetical protein